MRNKFSLLILLTILGLSFGVYAQNKNAKPKPQTVAKTVECKSNEISFPCPKGSIILASEESNGLLVLQNKKNKEDVFGLFIIAPKDSFDESRVVEDASATVLRKLFPKEPQNYKSNSVRNFESANSESQHKVSVKTNLWFNGRHLAVIKYQHIVFNERHFLAGYIFEMDRGKDAKESFDNGYLTESPLACENLIKMISSITGEKLAKDACTFEITEQLN